MDNQHRQIKGYRELSQEEIDLMNEIKETGVELEKLIAKVNDTNTRAGSPTDCFRWAAIAQRDLQTGLMALTRAVAKPESF